MRRARPLRAALLTLLAATVLPAGAAAAAPADGCADGVRVVVDLTDLGGAVEVGCAAGDPATGREALLAAGFTATDDSAGMICAIDANPDPCPTEFAGSYWAYWSAQDGDAAWTAHTAGADTTDPAPGSLEGWRYNDGSLPPGLRPAEVGAAAIGAAEDPAHADGGTADPDTDTAAAGAGADNGAGWATVAGIGLLAALVAASAVVLLRRRRG